MPHWGGGSHSQSPREAAPTQLGGSTWKLLVLLLPPVLSLPSTPWLPWGSQTTLLPSAPNLLPEGFLESPLPFLSQDLGHVGLLSTASMMLLEGGAGRGRPGLCLSPGPHRACFFTSRRGIRTPASSEPARRWGRECGVNCEVLCTVQQHSNTSPFSAFSFLSQTSVCKQTRKRTSREACKGS